MPDCRELITLQFGNYANYIGTHFWNIQESSFSYDPQESAGSEIQHDVLYREGVNFNRQTTYTPRLLLVDLDGALKHMPHEGELYGNSIKRACNASENVETSVKKLKENSAWQEENIDVELKPAAHKNAFQIDLEEGVADINEKEYNLASSVDSWVDYQYARYHPRTINIIKSFKHQPEEPTFDTYCAGMQLWSSENFEDDFCDKIRKYVEECDYLQGFQTIFDCHNGFSGLATQALLHLNEEYAKASFAVPVFTPQNIIFKNADEAMSDSMRVVNSVMTFEQLIQNSSLFVPLSTCDRVWRQLGTARDMRSLQYQPHNLYQTSAILASYLDTISLRYRMKNATNTCSLAGFCGDLTNYNRKLAAAAFALPFPMQANEDLIDCLDKFEGKLLTSLTPSCNIGTDYVVQSLCVRGIPENRLKRPMAQAHRQMQMSAYKCQNVSEMFQLYLQCSHHASLAHACSVSKPMATRLPFPREMFDNRLNANGFFEEFQQRTAGEYVNTVPTLAAVQSSSKLTDTLDALHTQGKRIKMAKLHRYKTAGLEDDEYNETLEAVLLFRDNYNDDFDNL